MVRINCIDRVDTYAINERKYITHLIILHSNCKLRNIRVAINRYI